MALSDLRRGKGRQKPLRIWVAMAMRKTTATRPTDAAATTTRVSIGETMFHLGSDLT
jgi:hypothetical protein